MLRNTASLPATTIAFAFFPAGGTAVGAHTTRARCAACARAGTSTRSGCACAYTCACSSCRSSSATNCGCAATAAWCCGGQSPTAFWRWVFFGAAGGHQQAQFSIGFAFATKRRLSGSGSSAADRFPQTGGAGGTHLQLCCPECLGTWVAPFKAGVTSDVCRSRGPCFQRAATSDAGHFRCCILGLHGGANKADIQTVVLWPSAPASSLAFSACMTGVNMRLVVPRTWVSNPGVYANHFRLILWAICSPMQHCRAGGMALLRSVLGPTLCHIISKTRAKDRATRGRHSALFGNWL